MKNDLKEMCLACPWREGSLQGYLGPNTPQDMAKQISVGRSLPCHMTVDYANALWRSEMELATSKAQQCVGALGASSLCGVPPREAVTRKHQESLPDAVIDECFHPAEFVEYHEAAEVKSWLFKDGAGRIMSTAAGTVAIAGGVAPETIAKK